MYDANEIAFFGEGTFIVCGFKGKFRSVIPTGLRLQGLVEGKTPGVASLHILPCKVCSGINALHLGGGN